MKRNVHLLEYRHSLEDILSVKVKDRFIYPPYDIQVFLLRRHVMIEVAGAAVPQRPKERNINDILKVEFESLWRNGLSELIVDHTSETVCRDSRKQR
ncbi:hypothetical protein TNCV_4010261 [Trichonephila clavipes]|nr:hypothetical protein TNCV_4010261 [Trichonephila clavipes]